MRCELVVVVAVVLCGGCGSSPESPDGSKSSTSSSSSSSKPKLTKDEKAAKAAKELDDQLIAPPADVVAALGAEVYPGARVMKFMKGMRSEVRDIVRIDYIFFTTDEPKRVQDFYLAKLTAARKGDPVMETMTAFVTHGTNANGEEVTIQALGLPGRTTFHYVVTKAK